jgi:hypothetical protein
MTVVRARRANMGFVDCPRLTEVAAQCIERLANTGVNTADPITPRARNFVAASPRNSARGYGSASVFAGPGRKNFEALRSSPRNSRGSAVRICIRIPCSLCDLAVINCVQKIASKTFPESVRELPL